MLGSTLFNTFVSDLDVGIECTLMEFANDTTLSGEVEASEGRATLQEGLDGLEECEAAVNAVSLAPKPFSDADIRKDLEIVLGQELDLMILVDPFQLSIFCDSVTTPSVLEEQPYKKPTNPTNPKDF
ncbi:rna-directed dna polymerase from mobile element jockey-like [Willisornis vidua]|uniref:Rna-directed dna polymerase from mobile element jockey-like n=1 Tax=Willisornis vidua TaxID=1566151 RepID=A0ABQ9DHL1_9PASS|nr:rna-directed dna polymerase from mobile element jockey-like [Willisornis vidua]